MTWSYSGNPTTSDMDAVRFLIGDNVSGQDPTLSNEEINYLFTQTGSVYQAAHDACLALSSKYATMATSKSVGDMSISYSDRAAALSSLGDSLLELAARRDPPTPWIKPGNLKRAADKTVDDDNGTEFATGQMDNPNATTTATSYWR